MTNNEDLKLKIDNLVLMAESLEVSLDLLKAEIEGVKMRASGTLPIFQEKFHGKPSIS